IALHGCRLHSYPISSSFIGVRAAFAGTFLAVRGISRRHIKAMGAMRQRSDALIVCGFAGKRLRFCRGGLAARSLLYDMGIRYPWRSALIFWFSAAELQG